MLLCWWNILSGKHYVFVIGWEIIQTLISVCLDQHQTVFSNFVGTGINSSAVLSGQHDWTKANGYKANGYKDTKGHYPGSITSGNNNTTGSLNWRHNDHDGVWNHRPNGCLLNRLFRRRSKKTSKLRVTGICVGNSPGTGEFPAQRDSNAENVSIWWLFLWGNDIKSS